MPRRGVTVGKFYPPHRGHRRLIEAARSRCDELFVLVASRPREDPPAAKRLGWLQQMFPEVHFILVEDTYPEAPAVWAEVTVRELGFTPDVAFAGEDYGAAWAGEMGCGFEMVDRTRGASECAGRTVRSDPMGHWQCLDPIVRAYYARRVAVVGAESTGTTTIARNLAELKRLFVARHRGVAEAVLLGRRRSLCRSRSARPNGRSLPPASPIGC